MSCMKCKDSFIMRKGDPIDRTPPYRDLCCPQCAETITRELENKKEELSGRV